MNEKDISQRQLEECPDVFADMMNVLLFGGEEIVNPDDLRDAPTFSAYQDQENETLRELERDVAKYWTSANVRISYIGLENQTSIYKYMSLGRVYKQNPMRLTRNFFVWQGKFSQACRTHVKKI